MQKETENRRYVESEVIHCGLSSTLLYRGKRHSGNTDWTQLLVKSRSRFPSKDSSTFLSCKERKRMHLIAIWTIFNQTSRLPVRFDCDDLQLIDETECVIHCTLFKELLKGLFLLPFMLVSDTIASNAPPSWSRKFGISLVLISGDFFTKQVFELKM